MIDETFLTTEEVLSTAGQLAHAIYRLIKAGGSPRPPGGSAFIRPISTRGWTASVATAAPKPEGRRQGRR
jgi:hypothetical protein